MLQKINANKSKSVGCLKKIIISWLVEQRKVIGELSHQHMCWPVKVCRTQEMMNYNEL